MGVFDIFNRKKPVTETTSKSLHTIETQSAIGGFAAVKDLENIFRGENHDYDLAAGSYNKQILTVSRLVGTPVIKDGLYPNIQSLLFDEAVIVTLRAMINGTHWIFPRILADGKIGVEHIKDSAIGSGGLRVDPETGALLAVVIEETVEWIDGDFLNETKWADRRRKYTPDEIVEIWEGDRTIRMVRDNTLGIMPIPFAFNSLGEIRGTSAYSGVLRLLRDIHEVRRNRDETLAQIRPKAVITTSNMDKWLEENQKHTDRKEAYDPFATRFAVNQADEKFEFLSLPSGFVADHNAALDDNSKEQIVSSPLPEIFSGKMTTGNYASNEYQQQQGIQFIQTVRAEMSKAWHRLVNDMVKLHNYLHFLPETEPLEISWDNLELASPLTRSQVMMNCVSALAQMSSGGIPVEVCFDLLKQLQPQMPYNTAGELADAIKKTKADMPSTDPFDTSSTWGIDG
jgi:hypothetical protein